MNNYGKLLTPTTLQFERLLPGSIERVWEYLTNSEKRGKWFASGHMQLVPDGIATFHFQHDDFSPEPNPIPKKHESMKQRTTSSAKVLKIEAPHLLIIGWEGIVTFELTAVGDKVKLVLTHEKLPNTIKGKVGTLAGWHTHLDTLVDHLDGKTPKAFWPVHTALEAEYTRNVN